MELCKRFCFACEVVRGPVIHAQEELIERVSGWNRIEKQVSVVMRKAECLNRGRGNGLVGKHKVGRIPGILRDRGNRAPVRSAYVKQPAARIRVLARIG